MFKRDKERDPLRVVQVFSEVSVKDGLLMQGSRIVIPKILQQEVLKQIHSGH